MDKKAHQNCRIGCEKFSPLSFGKQHNSFRRLTLQPLPRGGDELRYQSMMKRDTEENFHTTFFYKCNFWHFPPQSLLLMEPERGKLRSHRNCFYGKRRSQWPCIAQPGDVWEQAIKKRARWHKQLQTEAFIHNVNDVRGFRLHTVTHTLSRSMSWLCLSLPSVVKRSLKPLIWSSSSGFRLNSAGNSDSQYLEGRTKRGESGDEN